jgi:glutaredoxin
MRVPLDMGLKVELYTKKDCSLCVVAREIILRVLKEIPFEFQEIDIELREDLRDKFKEEIPAVFVNGQRVFTYRVSEEKLRRILEKYQSKR